MSAEGNAYTNLLKMMSKQGYNKDNYTVIGKVTSLSPLKFLVNGLTIEEEDCIIAESLKDSERKIELTVTALTAGMTSAGYTPHTHTINALNITDGTLKIKSPLKLNDLVIVLIDGSSFYIIDRMVSP